MNRQSISEQKPGNEEVLRRLEENSQKFLRNCVSSTEERTSQIPERVYIPGAHECCDGCGSNT